MTTLIVFAGLLLASCIATIGLIASTQNIHELHGRDDTLDLGGDIEI